MPNSSNIITRLETHRPKKKAETYDFVYIVDSIHSIAYIIICMFGLFSILILNLFLIMRHRIEVELLLSSTQLNSPAIQTTINVSTR